MAEATILWAGKALSGTEEARLRKMIHSLQRMGSDLADDFARFLPEREDEWSAEDRTAGALAGPALHLQVDADDQP